MDNLDELRPAIVAGDTVAFGHFLSQVELTVRRSLRPFATRVDVEAVLQEAFLRLWQVAPRYVDDGRPNGLLHLLLRISRNLALDECKRWKPHGPSDNDPAFIDEAVSVWVEVDPMLRQRIQDCYDSLPPQPRMALSTRLNSEQTEPDSALAERCSMKPNTYFQNIGRARRLLADCLGKKGVRVPIAAQAEAL